MTIHCILNNIKWSFGGGAILTCSRSRPVLLSLGTTFTSEVVAGYMGYGCRQQKNNVNQRQSRKYLFLLLRDESVIWKLPFISYLANHIITLFSWQAVENMDFYIINCNSQNEWVWLPCSLGALSLSATVLQLVYPTMCHSIKERLSPVNWTGKV
jgi:hypothetical protein